MSDILKFCKTYFIKTVLVILLVGLVAMLIMCSEVGNDSPVLSLTSFFQRRQQVQVRHKHTINFKYIE